MSGHDRRGSLRKPLNVIIRLTGDLAEGIVHFASGDLSEGGVFIESDVLFDIGDVVDMEFCLPGEVEPIRVKGKIVRTNKERVERGEPLSPGMGVRFLDLDDSSEERIKRHLSSGT